MKNLFRKTSLVVAALSILLTSNASAEDNKDVNYEEKLPYMYSDPKWETYTNGDTGSWPLPKVNPHSTGIYSLASLNTIDYKEDRDKFYETAPKFKHSGAIEVVYKSNPSAPVTMGFPTGTLVQKLLGGDVVAGFKYAETDVGAYNNVLAKDELVMDSAQGQWLITNGIYSRDNPDGYGIQAKNNEGASGSSISTSNLASSPWGLTSGADYITPEDFLMGVSKAVYGVEQSRPIYIQTTPYRLARKTNWYVWTTPWPSCQTYWKYQAGEWKNQDVSYINPAHMDYSKPGCGQSKTMDRGEYVVHPEGYLNNVWQRYRPDQNVYVSPNVYELYFTRLLQKGIITTDEAFALIPERDDFKPNKEKNSVFTFSRNYGSNFYSEYFGYGKGNGVNSNKATYPTWSPELGALYTNREVAHIPLGHNLTDKDIAVTYSKGKNAYEKALGVRYTLFGNNEYGIRQVRLATDKEKGSVMTKRQVKLIEALRLIEKAMRIEQGDMTESEAEIITRKYGAQYLDELSENDRTTVSYLLAKGILNFENHQEYSNLQSPLTQSFAYKLIYRLANKDARLEFSKVTLTDDSDLPKEFQQVDHTIVTADIDKLSEVGSLTQGGKLIKNDEGEPLNLVSDFEFNNKATKLEVTPESPIPDRYVITSTIDDPLKYLYRSMPLVNVDNDGKPLTIATNQFKVFEDEKRGMFNSISSEDERYVGINKITYDPNKERYLVEFYAYGDDYESALQFIKANLTTRIESVTSNKEEKTVVTKETGIVTSSKVEDIVKDLTITGDIVEVPKTMTDAYSNMDTSIVGNTVVKGPATIKVDGTKVTNVNVLPKLESQIAVDPLDPSKLIAVNLPQLNSNIINVFNGKGSIVGKTKVLEGTVTSKVNTKGKNDISAKFEGFDVNLLKSADYMMTDREFTFTDAEGKQRTVKGSIVVSWKLDLPSLNEQHALVGDLVRPYNTDISRSTWIFTEPDNTSLKSLWDYNIGLNNAILRTITGKNIKIPSGYFAPTVDILIDSVNSTMEQGNKVYHQDITEKQLAEIQSSFFTEVATHLPKNWLQMYIGSIALSNYVAGTKDSNGQYPKNVRSKIDAKQSTKTHTYINPSDGLLRGMLVPNGLPTWSYLVFNQERPHEYANTYLANHSHLARFNLHTVYTIKDSIKYYGKFYNDTGEGLTPELDLIYAKDNYGNIYRDIPKSDYTFNVATESMQEQTEFFRSTARGQIVKNSYNETWIVANEGEYTYDLFSKKFTTAYMRKGEMVANSSEISVSTPITGVIASANRASFGKLVDGKIKSSDFMLTRAFDFTPRKEDVPRNTTFAAVRGGKLLPYQYKDVVLDDGSITTKLELVKVGEGEPVLVPQFVSLYKSVWNIEAGVVKWNKTFIGADPESYIKGSLVQLMKEDLVAANSPNIVMSQDIKGGTLDIGQSTATMTKRKAVFLVGATQDFVRDNKLDQQAVLDKFNANSDVVILADGTTASSAQYLTDKVAGGYDPTYTEYNNTLVIHDNKLKVATGTKLVEYTPNSSIQTVSLTAMLMEGVKLLNYGGSIDAGNYKVYTYQDIAPSTVISPFTNGDVPTPDVNDAFIADVAEPFQGLPTALEMFNSLEGYLADFQVKETWHWLVYMFIGLSITLSITTLLAHVLAQAPVSNVVLNRLLEVTGIDIPALMSFRAVSISDDSEPITWKRTILTSAMLGISPVMVFAFMRMQGWL